MYIGPLSTQAEAAATCRGHHSTTSDDLSATITLVIAPTTTVLVALDLAMQSWPSPTFATPLQAWLGATSANVGGNFPYNWLDGSVVNASLFATGQPDGLVTDRFPQNCVSTNQRTVFTSPPRLADAACNSRRHFFCGASVAALRALPARTTPPTAAPIPSTRPPTTLTPTFAPTPPPSNNCTDCLFGTSGPCKTVTSGVTPVTLCFPYIPFTTICQATLITCSSESTTHSPTGSGAPATAAPATPAPPTTAALGPCGDRCGLGITDATASCIIKPSIAAALGLPTDVCTTLSSDQTCQSDFDSCTATPPAPTTSTPAPTTPTTTAPIPSQTVGVQCTGCTLLGAGPHTCRGNNPAGGVSPEFCTSFEAGTSDCPVDFTRCVECVGCTGGSPLRPYTCRGAAAGPIPSTLCTTFDTGATSIQCPLDFEVCPGVVGL